MTSVTYPKDNSAPSLPNYCQYTANRCDQDLASLNFSGNFFIFPNEPATISTTVQLAIEELRRNEGSYRWTSWKDLRIAGKIVFCEICKSIKAADIVIADITTLNLNVLFEIGYAIGCAVPVLLIRDTSYLRDRRLFEELGILDTVGYIDFENSQVLAQSIRSNLRKPSFPLVSQDINRTQPIYSIKSIIDTDGSVKIFSILKKSGLRYRTFDPKESYRLSLHEAWKQVSSSLAVLTHLLDKQREGAVINNSRCAFVSGLAMATSKRIMMLHEGVDQYPIDYRDVIKPYKDVNLIPKIMEPFLKEVIETLQDTSVVAKPSAQKRLESIDLGDIAAENEISLLKDYFVPTGQFNLAKQGHRRIIVGRKGSGKTAIFYRIKEHYKGHLSHLLLDLKPEGHQFVKLRETVLTQLTPGLQEHTMTAFWHYMLLLEIAHKIVNTEEGIAARNPKTKQMFDEVTEAYSKHLGEEQGDFSERLLKLVEDINQRCRQLKEVVKSSHVTELIYKEDIRNLQNALEEYLTAKQEVWVLIDNLDKGWPVQGATDEDILILRTLLAATRKMQREFEKRKTEFKSLVFVRNDIYEHLIKKTADKEKDTIITLDWEDIELFRQIVLTRIKTSTQTDGAFEDVWRSYFAPLIQGEDSFVYIAERTLMRPRDILKFLQYALEIAINHNHDKVTEEDIYQAEKIYSEDLLQNLAYEIKDIYPQYPDIIYEFLGCPVKMNRADLCKMLIKARVPVEKLDDVMNMLIWFGFLGVVDNQQTRYSYQVQYATFKLGIKESSLFSIHPAFRTALECA